MKDYKQVKNGRWINKHTGYFVDKNMARKLNKLAKKSTKRNKKINYPKHRHQSAVKTLTVKVYKDGSFAINQHRMDDEDLLYYSHLISKYVDVAMAKYAKADYKKLDKK